MPKESAGLLLYRTRGGELEVLLVHPGGPFWQKRDAGAWTIPKGEIEPGQEALATALREFEEELGASPPVDPANLVQLNPIRQKGGKVVQAWAAEGAFDPATLRSNSFSMEWPPKSGRMQQFPEVDRVQWFRIGEAREKINPAQAGFLDELVHRVRNQPPQG